MPGTTGPHSELSWGGGIGAAPSLKNLQLLFSGFILHLVELPQAHVVPQQHVFANCPGPCFPLIEFLEVTDRKAELLG